MKLRKINGGILAGQGVIYRIFIIICNAIFFAVGAKVIMEEHGAMMASLIWNSINMALYFIYHYFWARIFKIGE